MRRGMTGDVGAPHDVGVRGGRTPRANAIEKVAGMCRNVETIYALRGLREQFPQRFRLDRDLPIVAGLDPSLVTHETHRTRP